MGCLLSSLLSSSLLWSRLRSMGTSRRRTRRPRGGHARPFREALPRAPSVQNDARAKPVRTERARVGSHATAHALRAPESPEYWRRRMATSSTRAAEVRARADELASAKAALEAELVSTREQSRAREAALTAEAEAERAAREAKAAELAQTEDRVEELAGAGPRRGE
eukprot:8917099-Pyramimonas_sp.AAC.1